MKMKEFGPRGAGRVHGPPLDPPLPAVVDPGYTHYLANFSENCVEMKHFESGEGGASQCEPALDPRMPFNLLSIYPLNFGGNTSSGIR